MFRVRYGQMPYCRVVVDTGLPDFRWPELSWQAEDTTVHRGEAGLAGPPKVSVPSLSGTSIL